VLHPFHLIHSFLLVLLVLMVLLFPLFHRFQNFLVDLGDLVVPVVQVMLLELVERRLSISRCGRFFPNPIRSVCHNFHPQGVNLHDCHTRGKAHISPYKYSSIV
jgi:hypothetical protein